MTATRRNVPQQRRSAEKVQAILRAGRELLQGDPDAFTARALADRAGVGAATIYRYFATMDDVVDAVIEEHAQISQALVAELLKRPALSATALFEAVLEGFLSLYRSRPELAELWRSPRLAARQRDVEWVSDRGLAHALGARLHELGLIPEPTAEDLQRLEAHWAAAGAMIGLALREDPGGNAVVLEELRLLVRQFGADWDGARP